MFHVYALVLLIFVWRNNVGMRIHFTCIIYEDTAITHLIPLNKQEDGGRIMVNVRKSSQSVKKVTTIIPSTIRGCLNKY